MWSAALTSAQQKDQLQPRLRMEGNGYAYPPGVPESFRCDPHDPEYNDKLERWSHSREVIGPEPYLESIKERFANTKKDSIVDIASIPRLQVIVKLANIHLTPEKPRYAGGSWHVEGQLNEQICASALYYYDADNISESLLAFRKDLDVDCELDLPYEQDDHRAIHEIYGFGEDSARLQVLGRVVTQQGRLITFPNILQHRVESFELEDKSKPGHRKLLALFLVDPYKPILSTSHVPPQQEDLWKMQVKGLGPLGDLPAELNHTIMNVSEISRSFSYNLSLFFLSEFDNCAN